MESGNENRVTLCEDGKYRWTYELNLYKNPTVFFLVWKIFFFVILGIFAFTIIFDAVEWGGFDFERILESLKFLGFFMIGMTVLTAFGYFLYAVMAGGKYTVEFEMDAKGVNHKQTDSQAKRARKVGKALFAGGIATGRFTTAGIGINSQRTEMYSDFEKTKKVKAYKRRNLIKVNGLLSHNQVYTAKGDFEFVKEFIISHCPNLKNN